MCINGGVQFDGHIQVSPGNAPPYLGPVDPNAQRMTFLFVEMMIYLLLLVFHCINGLLIFEAEKDLVTINDSVNLICKSSSITLQITKGLDYVGSFENVFNQLLNGDNTRWNITGSSNGMVLVLNVTVLRFLSRDVGLYTCKVNGTFGATAELKMAGSARKPPGVVVKLNYTARQHENVTLSYTIAAYPIPEPSQFVWKGCKNASEGSCSNSLDGMLKYNVKSEGLSSFLTIRDVNIVDFGMYQLSVSNGIGSPFIEWLHLTPIGKPESPSGFHVIQEEIRETSAVLTWVPGFDNGSPQTFYITYTKKGDLSRWITMSIQHTHEAQMNYTLRSLEPETEYIASIYASNEEGLSPTINDTFITLKHIPDTSGEQEDSHAGLIGGSIGGIAAVLVIIGVVFIVKKFRTSAKPAGQSDRSGKDSHGCKAAHTYEQKMITATDTSVYDALKNGDKRSGTDSLGCNAAEPYEKLSKEIDMSDYDALKKGNNGGSTRISFTFYDVLHGDRRR